jgi:hypothetical protein
VSTSVGTARREIHADGDEQPGGDLGQQRAEGDDVDALVAEDQDAPLGGGDPVAGEQHRGQRVDQLLQALHLLPGYERADDAARGRGRRHQPDLDAEIGRLAGALAGEGARAAGGETQLAEVLGRGEHRRPLDHVEPIGGAAEEVETIALEDRGGRGQPHRVLPADLDGDVVGDRPEPGDPGDLAQAGQQPRRHRVHAQQQRAFGLVGGGEQAAPLGIDDRDLGAHVVAQEVAREAGRQAGDHGDEQGGAPLGVEPLPAGHAPEAEAEQERSDIDVALARGVRLRAVLVVEHVFGAGRRWAEIGDVVAVGRLLVAEADEVFRGAGVGGAAGEPGAARGAVEDVARRRGEQEQAGAALHRRRRAHDAQAGEEIVQGILVGVEAQPAHGAVERREGEEAELADDHPARIGGDPRHREAGLAKGDALEHEGSLAHAVAAT